MDISFEVFNADRTKNGKVMRFALLDIVYKISKNIQNIISGYIIYIKNQKDTTNRRLEQEITRNRKRTGPNKLRGPFRIYLTIHSLV